MLRIQKSEMKCIDCGNIGIAERRRCRDCAKKHNRLRAKERYNKHGRYYHKSICVICGKPMKATRKTQLTHRNCVYKAIDDYNKVPRNKTGTETIGRDLIIKLGIKIPENFVLHHVDENPWNNEFSNLWLMSRSNHNSLHAFLRNQRSLYLKEYNSISENCWKTLRDQLTTAWLETTSANVLKIIDIAQSAGEPSLMEEASETMYRLPTD